MIEGIAAGLAANAITKAAALALRRIRSAGHSPSFTETVASIAIPPLTDDERSETESWLQNADGRSFAALDAAPHEELTFAPEDRARAIAAAILRALVEAATPAEAALLARMADAADASALALEGVVWTQDRLNLGSRALRSFPVDALDVENPTLDPPEWREFRSKLLSDQGDIHLAELVGTGLLRFLLNTPGVMFVESIEPQLTSDIRELDPSIVVPWTTHEQELVETLRRIRTDTGTDFRIITPGRWSTPLNGWRTEQIPTLSLPSAAAAAHSFGIDAPAEIDLIVQAANGRLELAAHLAQQDQPLSAAETALRLGQWWVADRPEPLPAEVEAGLALIAILEPLPSDAMELVASQVGAPPATLMRACQSAVQEGVLHLSTIFDDAYQSTEQYSFALPALADYLRIQHWSNRAYGLPRSIESMIQAVGVEHARPVFANAASAANRGVPVHGVDLEFAFQGVASTPPTATLPLMAEVAGQSASVCAAVIARVRQILDETDPELGAPGYLWDLALTALGFDLPEGWQLFVHLLSTTGGPPPENATRGLANLIESEDDDSRRADLRRDALETAAHALNNLAISTTQAAAIVDQALTLEWTTTKRNLVDPMNFYLERHWISVAESEQLAAELPAVTTGMDLASSDHAVINIIGWADRLSRFSRSGHTTCCGRELDERVARSLQACSRHILDGVRSKCADQPMLAYTFNDVAKLHDDVEQLDIPLSPMAALFLENPSHLHDHDPPAFIASPDSPKAMTWTPEAHQIIEDRERAKQEQLENWVREELAHDPTHGLREIGAALAEAESIPRSYPARSSAGHCYEILIRDTTDLLSLVEPALASDIDCFPVGQLLHRIAHDFGEPTLSEVLAGCRLVPHARPAAIRVALTVCMPDGPADEVLSTVRRADRPAIESTGSQPKCSATRLAGLLGHDDQTVRSAAALEFNPTGGDEQLGRTALPDAALEEWTAAILAIASADGFNAPFAEQRLFQALHMIARTQPESVEQWILERYEEMTSLVRNRDQICHLISSLSTESKTRLWTANQHPPSLVVDLPCFVRGDPAWLDHSIESGALTSHDALNAVGINAKPEDILSFAPVLVPRGVNPETLAGQVASRVWSGDGEAHFEELANKFAAAAADASDPHVVAVAQAAETSCRSSAAGLAERRRQRNTGELA